MLRALMTAVKVVGLTYNLFSTCLLIGALGYGVYKTVQKRTQS